jgi:hypothetical protein
VVEFDPPHPETPSFEGESADLVYFLSWAYAGRFGASHEMAVAAEHIRHEHAVDLRPLLNFADHEVEDADDEELLEHTWQEPSPLAACVDKVVAAFRSGDPALDEVQAEYPNLVTQLETLGRLARWAEATNARIRVTYEL